MKVLWVRKCQECLNEQEDDKPNPEKELSDAYRNIKCRKCKSMVLDYGSEKSTALMEDFV